MSLRFGFYLAALALVAGCARQAPPPAPPPAPAPPPFDRGAEITAASASLDHGDVAAARPRIAALLAHDPADPAALMLRDGIDGDPRALLGVKSFGYRLKPGETLNDLAARFLGDRLKAYALARYNGLPAPADIPPGTLLRIPGTAPASLRPRPRPAPRKPVATPKPVPADAADLRRQALAALGRGQRAQAVALLRRALLIDPANPLLRRDLARAERAGAR